MPNFNKCFIMGNLVKDAELRYSGNGNAILNWSLAYNEEWTDKGGQAQKRVHYFEFSIFGKRAEGLAPLLKKGMPLFVEGRLTQDVWDDKDTGQKRHAVKIIATNVEFVGSKRQDSGGQQQRGDAQERPARAEPAPRPAAAQYDDDDVPF